MVYQPLRTINAEEMKRIIRLNERVQAQYEGQDGDEDVVTTQPDALTEAFPPAKAGEELNVADVLVTCNFLFRDALVIAFPLNPGLTAVDQSSRVTNGSS